MHNVEVIFLLLHAYTIRCVFVISACVGVVFIICLYTVVAWPISLLCFKQGHKERQHAFLILFFTFFFSPPPLGDNSACPYALSVCCLVITVMLVRRAVFL